MTSSAGNFGSCKAQNEPVESCFSFRFNRCFYFILLCVKCIRTYCFDCMDNYSAPNQTIISGNAQSILIVTKQKTTTPLNIYQLNRYKPIYCV